MTDRQTQSTQTPDFAVIGGSRPGSRVPSYNSHTPPAAGAGAAAATGTSTRKRKARSEEEDVTKAFKHAALSLTTLYKASQRCRREGWLDCLDEVYDRFIAPAIVTDHHSTSSDDGEVDPNRRRNTGIERIHVENLDLGRLIAWVRENRRSAFADAVHDDLDEDDQQQQQQQDDDDVDLASSDVAMGETRPATDHTTGTKRKAGGGR